MTEPKMKQTARGFDYTEFKDKYDNNCSLQKSSLATEDCIWFGVDDYKPQILASKTEAGGTGWVPYYISSDVSTSTRMHLTQDMVRELLPILERFADTGELG